MPQGVEVHVLSSASGYEKSPWRGSFYWMYTALGQKLRFFQKEESAIFAVGIIVSLHLSLVVAPVQTARIKLQQVTAPSAFANSSTSTLTIL